jgi:hypothetical protein
MTALLEAESEAGVQKCFGATEGHVLSGVCSRQALLVRD